MANQENIEPHKFKQGQSGNPDGRPKKFVSHILQEIKDAGYQPVTKSQIKDIYENMLSLPDNELTKLGTDKETPMIYRIIARNMMSPKGFDIIEKMLDRTQGKPTNKVEVEINELDQQIDERLKTVLQDGANDLQDNSDTAKT